MKTFNTLYKKIYSKFSLKGTKPWRELVPYLQDILVLLNGQTVEIDSTDHLLDKSGVTPDTWPGLSRAGKTVYYVRKSGSTPASPYTSEATAAATIGAVLTYIKAAHGSGNDLIDIGEGEYDETLYLADADLNDIVFCGDSRDGTVIKPATGTVVSTGANLTSASFYDLTLTGQATNQYIAWASNYTGTILLNNVHLRQPDGSTTHIWRTSGALKVRNCKVSGRSVYDQARYGFYITGAGSLDMAFTRLIAKGSESFAPNVVLLGSGNSRIVNCAILGTSEDGIYINNAGATVTLENNIISAGQADHLNAPISKTAGVLVARNNKLMCSQYNSSFSFIIGLDGGDTDENNIVTFAEPGFTSARRGGYLLPMVDDVAALGSDYLSDLETLFSTKEVTGTFFINTVTTAVYGFGPDDYQDVRDFLLNGIFEIACHGRTHQRLADEHALNISYGGTDSGATVEYTSGGIIQLRTTEGNDDLDIDTATYSTLGEIFALSGTNDWTIAYSTTDGQTVFPNVITDVDAESLLVLAETAAPCDIDFDRTGIEQGLFKDQIADGKAQLESIIGTLTDPQTGNQYTPRTYGATYNQADSDVEEAVKAAGFETFRYAYTDFLQSTAPLVELDCYKLHHGSCLLLNNGTDETNVKNSARALAHHITTCGMATSLLAHSTTDLTIEQWGWVLDVFTEEYPEITICSYQQMLDEVRASGLWTEGVDNTFTRTFAEPDLSLDDDSLLVNAGVDPFATGDGDQHDAAGNKVWDATYDTPDGYWLHGVDIGAYSSTGAVLYGNHFEIVSGDGWADYVIKAPLAPSLLAADDGTLFTTGVANTLDAVDLAAMTGDQFFFSTRRGAGIFREYLTGTALIKADRWWGFN